MSFLCTPSASVKRTDYLNEISAVRCKRWSCPHCAEVNRKRVIALAVAGKPTAFLTLTVSSANYETPDEAARDLKRGLVALRKRIARAYPGGKMSFLAVFEKHKSGYPHLHLLIRAPFLPIKWLKAAWEEITGSFMVDIRQVKNVGQRAFYVAKYVGKDLAAFENCKRWWRSHDYNEPANDNDDDRERYRGWGRIEADAYQVARFVSALGFDVERVGDGRFRWHAPPDKIGGFVDLARGARWWFSNKKNG